MTLENSSYQSVVLGRPFIDGYFKFWALVLPVTSVLIFPAIQGTTPAYILAFLSVFIVLCAAQLKDIKRYFTIFAVIIFSYTTLNLISQFFLSLYHTQVNLESLPLVEPLSFTQAVMLRPTLFTQSLYLAAGLLTFMFVYQWYRPSWDSYIFAGILLLVAYGFYEVFYYWMTGDSGDFLSNRRFNDRHSGSLFQTINLSGLRMQRMKSLTGEPSMFAFTVLPYWVFALHTRRFTIGFILTLALFLSTSTTAIIGIILYIAVLLYSNRVDTKYIVAGAVGIIIVFALNFRPVLSVLNKLIFQKFSLASISGVTRFTNLQDSVMFWADMPLPTKLFGMGFGYIRSTDFFSTILVNNGLFGLIILIIAFTYPMIALDRSNRSFGLKCALLVILISMLMSVPEFAYLPVWLFLGISYNYINHSYDVPSKHLYRRCG